MVTLTIGLTCHKGLHHSLSGVLLSASTDGRGGKMTSFADVTDDENVTSLLLLLLLRCVVKCASVEPGDVLTTE